MEGHQSETLVRNFEEYWSETLRNMLPCTMTMDVLPWLLYVYYHEYHDYIACYHGYWLCYHGYRMCCHGYWPERSLEACRDPMAWRRLGASGRVDWGREGSKKKKLNHKQFSENVIFDWQISGYINICYVHIVNMANSILFTQNIDSIKSHLSFLLLLNERYFWQFDLSRSF